jgi:hypothetical protein
MQKFPKKKEKHTTQSNANLALPITRVVPCRPSIYNSYYFICPIKIQIKSKGTEKREFIDNH